MIAYLEKLFLTIVDAVARTLIYNTNAPKVGAVFRNVPYALDDSKQRMDIVCPAGDSRRPIIVFIHGGGWVSGNKDNYLRLCKCYAREGYVVFSINYRLAPRFPFPLPLHDIALAIEWIVLHASEYQGDPTRLVLAGDSAGAHMAAWFAAGLRERQLFDNTTIKSSLSPNDVKGLLLFYGIYNLKTLKETGFPGIWSAAKAFLNGASEELASPIYSIDSSFPPSFICCSERDWLCSQSLELAQQLEEKGVLHETMVFSKNQYPEACHPFMELYFLRCSKQAFKASITFLPTVLGHMECE